jgi:hypothetical protein
MPGYGEPGHPATGEDNGGPEMDFGEKGSGGMPPGMGGGFGGPPGGPPHPGGGGGFGGGRPGMGGGGFGQQGQSAPGETTGATSQGGMQSQSSDRNASALASQTRQMQDSEEKGGDVTNAWTPEARAAAEAAREASKRAFQLGTREAHHAAMDAHRYAAKLVAKAGEDPYPYKKDATLHKVAAKHAPSAFTGNTGSEQDAEEKGGDVTNVFNANPEGHNQYTGYCSHDKCPGTGWHVRFNDNNPDTEPPFHARSLKHAVRVAQYMHEDFQLGKKGKDGSYYDGGSGITIERAHATPSHKMPATGGRPPQKPQTENSNPEGHNQYTGAMDNASLKQGIERIAGVKLKVSTYKSGNDPAEAHVAIHDKDAESFVFRGKTYIRGNARDEVRHYGAKTRRYAAHQALLKAAAKLGVEVKDKDAVKRAEEADFRARTGHEPGPTGNTGSDLTDNQLRDLDMLTNQMGRSWSEAWQLVTGNEWNPDQPRDERGRFGSGGGGLGEHEDKPIKVKDVNEAVKLLGQGRKIELSQPREVSTLLNKLKEMVDDARAKGEKAPTYDLCNVSVPGTSLFCAESKGVPRIKMPQLKGRPTPGSPADKLPKDAKGEVDLSDAFKQYLEDKGVKITDETEDAKYLRASQNELNGGKVAGMSAAMKEGKIPDAPIWVSKDNYVVDGHHRWASKVGLEYGEGKTVTMPVKRADMPIMSLLEHANRFTHEMGIGSAGVANRLVANNWSEAARAAAAMSHQHRFGMPPIESDSAPGNLYYYHATHLKNLDAISKGGLKSMSDFGTGISLAPHLQSVNFWGDAAGAGEQMAILRMPRAGIRVSNEPEDEYDEHDETAETATYKPVPASKLEVYHNGSWKPLSRGPTSNQETDVFGCPVDNAKDAKGHGSEKRGVTGVKKLPMPGMVPAADLEVAFYHGTSNAGRVAAGGFRKSIGGTYLSADPEMAGWYSTEEHHEGPDPGVLKVKLKPGLRIADLRNAPDPESWEAVGLHADDPEVARLNAKYRGYGWIGRLREHGYDGAWSGPSDVHAEEMVVFDPRNIQVQARNEWQEGVANRRQTDVFGNPVDNANPEGHNQYTGGASIGKNDYITGKTVHFHDGEHKGYTVKLDSVIPMRYRNEQKTYRGTIQGGNFASEGARQVTVTHDHVSENATLVGNASFFSICEHDKEGHCLPSGEGKMGVKEGFVQRLGRDKEEIFHTGSAREALVALSMGHRVQLTQPRKVATLLDKLQAEVKAAAASGKPMVPIDLCRLSVPGTNLFCVESKGIPRIKMPQLRGVPEKGSEADVHADLYGGKDAKGKVTLQKYFVNHLVEQGVKVEPGVEDAGMLKASQNQIDGAKAARMMVKARKGEEQEPIIVSRDNYIVDGHHHWAGLVAHKYDAGTGGKVPVPIRRVDMDIIELLDRANKYAASKGMKAESVTGNVDVTNGWVTIQGTHVFIKDGVITKGPKGVVGKKPGELPGRGARGAGGAKPSPKEKSSSREEPRESPHASTASAKDQHDKLMGELKSKGIDTTRAWATWDKSEPLDRASIKVPEKEEADVRAGIADSVEKGTGSSFRRHTIKDLYEKHGEGKVSVKEFHGILSRMQDEGKLRMGPYTQALPQHEAPQFLLPKDREAKYYVDKAPTRNADVFGNPVENTGWTPEARAAADAARAAKAKAREAMEEFKKQRDAYKEQRDKAVEAYGTLRDKAQELHDSHAEAMDGVSDRVDDVAAVEGTELDRHVRALESAKDDYDPDAKTSERLASIRQMTDHADKALDALKGEQPSAFVAPTYSKVEGDLRAALAGHGAAENVVAKYPEAKAVADRLMAEGHLDKDGEGILRFKEGHPTGLEGDDEHLTKDQIDANHAHLTSIKSGLELAAKHLAERAKVRREMKRVRDSLTANFGITFNAFGQMVENKEELDTQGGSLPNTDPEELAEYDFITLPKGVAGTNCGNCVFLRETDDGHICGHEKLKGQRVTDKNCCALWDANGTLREYHKTLTGNSWCDGGRIELVTRTYLETAACLVANFDPSQPRGPDGKWGSGGGGGGTHGMKPEHVEAEHAGHEIHQAHVFHEGYESLIEEHTPTGILVRHAIGPAIKGMAALSRMAGGEKAAQALEKFHSGAVDAAHALLGSLQKKYGLNTATAIVNMSHLVTSLAIHATGAHFLSAIPGKHWVTAMPLIGLAWAAKKMGMGGALDKAMGVVNTGVAAVVGGVKKGAGLLGKLGLKASYYAGRGVGKLLGNEEHDWVVNEAHPDDDKVTLSPLQLRQEAQKLVNEMVEAIRPLYEKHKADLAPIENFPATQPLPGDHEEMSEGAHHDDKQPPPEMPSGEVDDARDQPAHPTNKPVPKPKRTNAQPPTVKNLLQRLREIDEGEGAQ